MIDTTIKKHFAKTYTRLLNIMNLIEDLNTFMYKDKAPIYNHIARVNLFNRVFPCRRCNGKSMYEAMLFEKCFKGDVK